MQRPTAVPAMPASASGVDAVRAEAIAETGRGAENASRAPDVLAHHDHVRRAQLDVEAVVDGFDQSFSAIGE